MARTKIELDRPCTQPGVAFEERADGRFCLSCREMQHDLRDVTRREALALFAASGGRLCGRFRVGPAGELKFREEAPSSGNAARGALLALALAACDRPEPSIAPEPSVASPPPTTSVPVIETPPPVTEAPTPPVSEAPTPPATEALPPPETHVDTVTRASGEPSHETDTSLDPADHRGHWHRHPPVIIGHSEMHGGARATPHTEDPNDPLRDLDL